MLLILLKTDLKLRQLDFFSSESGKSKTFDKNSYLQLND